MFATFSKDGPGQYSWDDIKVAPSGLKKRRDGGLDQCVKAKRNIPAGLWIPICGRPHHHLASGNHYAWCEREYVYHRTTAAGTPVDALRQFIDGTPMLHPYKQVGCGGLSIAMMLNEPSDATPTNCFFHLDYVVATKDIKKGQELLIDYGTEYRRYGYKTHRSVDTRDQEREAHLAAIRNSTPNASVRHKLLVAMDKLVQADNKAKTARLVRNPVPTLAVDPRVAMAVALGEYKWEQHTGTRPLIAEFRLPLTVNLYSMKACTQGRSPTRELRPILVSHAHTHTHTHFFSISHTILMLHTHTHTHAHAHTHIQDELKRRVGRVRELEGDILQLPGTSCFQFDEALGEWHDCSLFEDPNHDCTLGKIVAQVTYTELLSPEQADKEVDPTVRVPGAMAYRIDTKTVRLCEPFVEPDLVGKSRRWKKMTPETQVLVNTRLHDMEFGVGCRYEADNPNWGAMICDCDHPLCNDRRDRQAAKRAIKRKREEGLDSDPCATEEHQDAAAIMWSMSNDCDHPARVPTLPGKKCDHPICIVRRAHQTAKRRKLKAASQIQRK